MGPHYRTQSRCRTQSLRSVTDRACADRPDPSPGFGQTGAKAKTPGRTSWPQQLGDISFFLAHAATLHPGVPLYLFGHSMGGGLSLAFATRSPPSPGLELLKGVVASSPLLRQSPGVRAPKLLVSAGNILGKISGSLTLTADVKAEVELSLTRAWPAS